VTHRSILSALVLVCLAGCGSSKTTDVAPKSKPVPPGPEVSVQKFLAAIQSGNDEQAAEMLTDLAREKTAEMGMMVAPPGNEDASFKIGVVEIMPNNVAHVASSWDDEGETHEIIWALRREKAGWRIGGLATKLFPDQENPLILNFEDPADMERQQALAEQEIMRRAAQEEAGEQQDVAGQPDAPQKSVR
jgi:hypothetical protein